MRGAALPSAKPLTRTPGHLAAVCCKSIVSATDERFPALVDRAAVRYSWHMDVGRENTENLAAIVFPGQGSQRSGMALDFVEQFSEARQILDQASSELGLDVESILRDEDPRLNLTEYTQPCILTAEIAMHESLKARFDLRADYFAGHSLGEYAALVAAGALPFGVAVKLVRARGRLMQSAVSPGQGAMSAVILENLPFAEVSALAQSLGVDIANDNSIHQVVLSGAAKGVAEANAALAERFQNVSIRVVPLEVSAPFHSRQMKGIESEFRGLLSAASSEIRAERATHVASNYTGAFHTGKLEDLIEALTLQISGQVRWRDNMTALLQQTSRVYEIGPGRPLTGFFKTLGQPVTAITDLRTARRAFPSLGEAGSGTAQNSAEAPAIMLAAASSSTASAIPETFAQSAQAQN